MRPQWRSCVQAGMHTAGAQPAAVLALTTPASNHPNRQPTHQLHPSPLLRPLQSDWRVVQRGYYAHVLGEAPHYFQDPVEAVRTLKKGNSVSGERSE